MTLTTRTLVLDLDECLIETFRAYNDDDYLKMVESYQCRDRSRFYRFDIYDPEQPKGIGLSETYWGIKRPHLDTFLSFAFKYFQNVVVWSAAQKKYVEPLVKIIFRDHPRPVKIFTWDDVTQVDHVTTNYHKPISTILKSDLKLSQDDIVFVDDKADNFRANPHNGIVIPKFAPRFEVATQKEDIRLLQIMQWLLLPEIMEIKDFRKTDKSKIFLTDIRNENLIHEYVPDDGFYFETL